MLGCQLRALQVSPNTLLHRLGSWDSPTYYQCFSKCGPGQGWRSAILLSYILCCRAVHIIILLLIAALLSAGLQFYLSVVVRPCQTLHQRVIQLESCRLDCAKNHVWTTLRRFRAMQVLVFDSICQGAMLVHVLSHSQICCTY